MPGDKIITEIFSELIKTLHSQRARMLNGKHLAKGSYNENAFAANNMPNAGSSTFANANDYKMQFMSTSQRHTGV